MSSIQQWKPNQILLLEYLIENPSATRNEMSEVAGVSVYKVSNWLKDPIFVEAFYDRYMISFGTKLPSVLDSMVREALEGNVQAGRLVLEHSGKLVKNVHIKHESPFEKFIAAESVKDITDAEFDEAIVEELVKEEIKEEFKELPKRNKENDSPHKRLMKETKRIKSAKELELKNERQKKNYALRKRAERVGLKPLPGGRPNKYDRKRWLKELEKREANLHPSPQT